MTPDRFEQLEELYHAVRATSGAERAKLLAASDAELRREVEALLAACDTTDVFDRPAFGNAPGLLDEATLTAVAVGHSLGPYRIESKLGEGGMGLVYRAIDTRLGRPVAVKTSRDPFDPRFEREARAISALNHPNICTLYDVGPDYIVMELVEGQTLASLLTSGPLPAETARLYALQMAAALAEAHSKNIIHRDLKPGNIMIGKSGVKVLDFGLARAADDKSLTATHAILGTPAYMAPEQKAGKPADHRSDLYAFGLVLYEMATGTRPGPQRKRIPNRTLETVVTRCLEEDPRKRWQSAAELQQALAKHNRGRRGIYAAVLAATLVVAAVATGYVILHRPRTLTSKDKIVVAEFENNTGDPIFEPTLRQALTSQLQQSPFLALVPDQEIRQVLRLMQKPPETRLTRDVSKEVCERTGSSAVLDGSIGAMGSQYVLWVRARNCRTGTVLAEEQAHTDSKEKVVDALSRIAIQTRTRLGESLASIQEHSAPLEEATTSSLEALKAYSAAKVAMFSVGGPAGIPHLKQAIAIDPQFAMAHADLGFMVWGMGQTELGAEEVRIAWGLRDHLSDREQRYILMLYDRQVTGNLPKELATLESWAQVYPRDPIVFGILGGWGTFGTGQYERGIQASQKALQLSPEIGFLYAGIATDNLCLNRFTEAAQALQLAVERKLETPDFLITRYYLAFLKGDQPGMEREMTRARGIHAEDWLDHNQALVLARSGRMAQARILWDRAISLAQQAGKKETAALYRAAEAVSEAHCLNVAASKNLAREALRTARGRDVVFAAAFALARSGEMSEAQSLAAELEKRFPEDTPVQFEYLPTLNALFALSRRAPENAVERLQRAVPYDFAMPGTLFFGKFGALYPAYVRGEAYLAAGRSLEAVAEFQKVIDHPGLVLADPVGALVHLQMGRAHVGAGNGAKAKEAYSLFFALWKEADRDLPVIKQARAEYAKL